MQKISLLVTDDHTLVREAWVTVLNSDPRFTVIAEASNAEEAIEKVKELLVYDELSLSQIADQLGYSSVAYLSNQFKKNHRVYPQLL